MWSSTLSLFPYSLEARRIAKFRCPSSRASATFSGLSNPWPSVLPPSWDFSLPCKTQTHPLCWIFNKKENSLPELSRRVEAFTLTWASFWWVRVEFCLQLSETACTDVLPLLTTCPPNYPWDNRPRLCNIRIMGSNYVAPLTVVGALGTAAGIIYFVHHSQNADRKVNRVW